MGTTYCCSEFERLLRESKREEKLLPLVTGSVAAGVYFKDFRKPVDVDLVMQPFQWVELKQELDREYNYPYVFCKSLGCHKHKVSFQLPGKKYVEVMVVSPESRGSTSLLLKLSHANPEAKRTEVKEFSNLTFLAVPPSLSAATKWAHSPFSVHWLKTLEDLHYFSRRSFLTFSKEEEAYWQLLRNEIQSSKPREKNKRKRYQLGVKLKKKGQEEVCRWLEEMLKREVQALSFDSERLAQKYHSVRLYNLYSNSPDWVRKLVVEQYPRFKFRLAPLVERKNKVVENKKTEELDFFPFHTKFSNLHYLGHYLDNLLPKDLLTQVSNFLEGSDFLPSSDSSSSSSEEECMCNTMMWAYCSKHPCTCGLGCTARPYHAPSCYHHL